MGIMNPKYNPARTYTPQGAIGIGGTFMCLYPTASPGGRCTPLPFPPTMR